jgi:hypothetical protein
MLKEFFPFEESLPHIVLSKLAGEKRYVGDFSRRLPEVERPAEQRDLAIDCRAGSCVLLFSIYRSACSCLTLAARIAPK